MKHHYASEAMDGSGIIPRMSVPSRPFDPPGSLALFSREWADAWCAEVASTDDWSRSSGGWAGTLAFEATGVEGEPVNRSIVLELDADGCRSGRTADEADLARADYRLTATAASWDRLLAGDLDPMWAVMAGKLKIASGEAGGSMPSQAAARVIFAAAKRVAAQSPGSREA